jgi:hypothetical protein
MGNRITALMRLCSPGKIKRAMIGIVHGAALLRLGMRMWIRGIGEGKSGFGK